ncbi:MAG TPA: GNAT family protein [Mobilitalea sp.]|nr:GNAT family protein [Mobilitalea sp.]
MRELQVNLKQEVTRIDAIKIMNWMENNEVTRYLNELTNITSEIRHAIERVNMLVMTHLFNRNGSFYIISTDQNHTVGFLKLVKKASDTEIVIVIGDKNNWGHGLGKKAIHKGLSLAFFEWRVPRVIAKIDPGNARSIKAFKRSGFVLDKETPHLMHYSITMDDYIKNIIAK